MTVREASEGDIEMIKQIAQVSWEVDYPAILNRENVDEAATEWYTEDRLRTALADEKELLTLAETNSTAVGFAHCAWDNANQTGAILRLYILPDHRRASHGATLLDHARDVLSTRSIEEIQAMVLAENEQGNTFYRAHGFEKVGEADTEISGTTYRENTYTFET
jgi:ribosomal protein S18 acetylase RimI-like enzyme